MLLPLDLPRPNIQVPPLTKPGSCMLGFGLLGRKGVLSLLVSRSNITRYLNSDFVHHRKTIMYSIHYGYDF